MAQRTELASVSGLKVQRRESYSGCHAVDRRSIFVDLLSWQRSMGAELSAGGKAKASCLFQLLRLAKEHRSEAVFAVCCLFVMAVSVHDAMLVVLNANVIGEIEQNPLGRWLIELQGGEIWLFVVMKLMGTAVVGAVLVTLYRFRARLALAASSGVAAFQMVLLCYLTFAKQ